MKKQDSNIDNKQIIIINEKQIDKIISFIINNRKVIDVYFFIGSGFLKYLLNGNEKLKNLKINYLSWQQMFNKKFSRLSADHFHDLTTIDFKYEEKIKKIIEFNDKQFEKNNVVNNKNNGLKKIYNTIRNIIINDNKPENSIRFITTNHCNTINKYFEIYDEYYLENSCHFLKENFSILNMHSKNKNELIYKIEHYVDLFSQKNENEKSYINKILNLANSIKEKDQEIKRKKIFFLFGTSFSELHLNVFINKIKSDDHPIVWFRDISQIIRKTNIKSFNKEVLFKNLKKFLQKQEKKCFWHIFLRPKGFDNLFKIFNKKLKEELLKYINFSYEYIPHRKFDEKYFSELTNIKRKILEDYRQSEDKEENLDKKFEEKNYDYIGTVLSENEENEIAINWYFKNIELFEKTPININWFLTLWVLGNNKLKFADKLINTCIKNNNDYNIDILVWIKHVKSIKKNNWELIINIVWNRLLLIDANNWTLDRIAKYDNEQQKLDVKNKKKHSNSLKLLIIKHVKKTYGGKIIFVEAFFNLYWLKKITNLDFDIIEIIKTATEKEINQTFYNCNFGIYLNNLRTSYSKICILAFQKYFKTNLDQLEELINDLKNSDDFLKMSYILDKNEFDNSYIKMFENRSKELNIDSKELQKPFDINDYSSDFNKKLSGFLSNFVKEKTNLEKLESNIDECLESIKEEKWFSKMDFFQYIGSIFNEIIINKDIDFKKNNELIEKMNKLIIQYNEKKHNKNNYFVTYDERYEELKLNDVVDVICDLNKKEIKWFSKTLIMTFTFNHKLRPDFDFYMITNKNFSFITLLSKLNKEKIDLQNIFNENKDQELIKIYLDIFNKPHENFKNENYLFLKFVYDVYTEKESENLYIPWFKEEKINKNFFEFLEKWCLLKQDFHPIIYLLFISKIIQHCQTNFAIDLILSKESINIYKKANCEYFFYWIDDILKKTKKQDQNKEEIEKLLTKFIKNIDFENIKILIPQFLDKKEYWKCLRNINKFIKQNNKPDLVKNSEMNWFTEEVFEYIWLIKDNNSKYKNSLYNLFLSMLFFYKLEKNNNPEEKKWNLIFNTLKAMKNLTNLKELKKLEKIVENFIKEAKNLT